MTPTEAKAAVMARHSTAKAVSYYDGAEWLIWIDCIGPHLGAGATEDAAWQAAAEKLPTEGATP